MSVRLQMEAWTVFDRKYAEGWKRSDQMEVTAIRPAAKQTIRTIIKPAFHYNTFIPIITYYYIYPLLPLLPIITYLRPSNLQMILNS